jgi:hypothetical protein
MAWPLIKLLPEKTNLDFVGFARAAGVLSIIAVLATAVRFWSSIPAPSR